MARARTENVVHLFRNLVAIADGGMTGGRGDVSDRIWDRALADLLRNAVDFLLLAQETVSLRNIAELINTSARSEEDVRRLRELAHAVSLGKIPEMELTYFEECWLAASRNYMQGSHSVDRHSLAQTIAFWRDVWPRMPHRTRGSVEFTFQATASALLRGDLAELFCTETNITPEVTL